MRVGHELKHKVRKKELSLKKTLRTRRILQHIFLLQKTPSLIRSSPMQIETG